METEWTLERVLNLALMKEEESIQLYTAALEKVKKYPESKAIIMELIQVEEKHRDKIKQIMQDPSKLSELGPLETKIQDLKIVDYLEDVVLTPEADYQEILIFAGKREKNAHEYYMWLAKHYPDTQIGELFKKLAQEELKHKLQLEKEYDDVILKNM